MLRELIARHNKPRLNSEIAECSLCSSSGTRATQLLNDGGDHRSQADPGSIFFATSGVLFAVVVQTIDDADRTPNAAAHPNWG